MTVYEEPVWEEPTIRTKMRKYERVLVPLTEYPDTWGKIGEYKSEGSAYQAAINLKKGRYVIPGSPEEWEFASDGYAVFARYLGQTNGRATKSTRKKSS